MGEVRVVGIRVEQPANQPVLLLRESEGGPLPADLDRADRSQRHHPGTTGVEPVRPLTHDLFRDVIGALGHSLKEVRIVDLQEWHLLRRPGLRFRGAGPGAAVGLGGHRTADGCADLRGGRGPRRGRPADPGRRRRQQPGGAVREDKVEKFKESSTASPRTTSRPAEPNRQITDPSPYRSVVIRHAVLRRAHHPAAILPIRT